MNEKEEAARWLKNFLNTPLSEEEADEWREEFAEQARINPNEDYRILFRKAMYHYPLTNGLLQNLCPLYYMEEPTVH